MEGNGLIRPGKYRMELVATLRKINENLWLIYADIDEPRQFEVDVEIYKESKALFVDIYTRHGDYYLLKLPTPRLDFNKSWIAFSCFIGRGQFIIFLIDRNYYNKLLDSGEEVSMQLLYAEEVEE